MPADPGAYKAELPADFKAPEGVNFEFNADDPLMGHARSLMHDIDQGRVSGQEAFSRMLGLYAAGKVDDSATLQTAKAAEITKLGVNGPARIDMLKTQLTAHGGKHFDALVKVLDYAPVASTVEGLEFLMNKISSQGVANFDQRHRDNSGEKLSDEAYEKLSYSEKKAYAAKHTKAA